ncbi:hypothetical protein [Georgenia subflava]|uniref:hypothetical protein n=1 Tax=Georgenia subflava TaxID=1622177 RepID=UPI001D02E158|nr:hypothetical protein [Georgenia subflava]
MRDPRLGRAEHPGGTHRRRSERDLDVRRSAHRARYGRLGEPGAVAGSGTERRAIHGIHGIHGTYRTAVGFTAVARTTLDSTAVGHAWDGRPISVARHSPAG